jgi:hypothetical protein
MRHLFSMPPQVVRLCLLAVGIVTAYSIARYFLTPPSFQEYGWYRGDALAELAAREPVYAGKKACDECHSELVQKLQKGDHKTLACEGCHGPGEAHAANPDVKIDKSNYGACVRCHEANPSRPKWHKQIVVKTHYRETKPETKAGEKPELKPSLCTECHVPHAPSEVP